MNFEYLVQRYIDGEITPVEDLQLQQLMKESPYLRSQFDHIVHIQHSYSQTTKPLLNERDSAAIFDTLKIAMVASIASTAHAPMTTSSVFAVASNVVLPVLLSLFFLLTPNNATSPLLKYVAFKAPESLIASTENSVNQRFDSGTLNKKNTTNSFVHTSSEQSAIVSDQHPFTDNSVGKKHFISSLQSAQDVNEWNDKQGLSFNEDLLPIPNSEINGTDVLSYTTLLPSLPFVSYNVPIKFEFTVSASSQNANTLGSLRSTPIMSQYLAINYGIDEVNRFGIEFGSTSFIGLAYGAVTKPQSVENDTYGSGIQGASNSNDDTPGNPVDNTKIKPTNQNKYYCEDIEFRKDIQIFQSSVFYERELFETSLFAVNSRVGVGVTNIGITSYTKTLIEVKPNDNFSIFGGAEYRVLTGNAGSALQQDTRASSMMSIQTGITIKF